MKNGVIFLLTILFSNVCLSQSNTNDCERFRKGIYSYKDSSGFIWEIKRTKNHQTETNKNTGLLVKNKIKWLGVCEYRLTQIWANKKERRKSNNQQSTIRIIKTTPDSYEYACSCTVDNSNQSRGLVVKISD